MSATLIDGKALAAALRQDVRRRADALAQRGRRPCLAAVLVGDDDGSRMYAASQTRSAGEAGIEHRLVELPASSSPSDMRGRVAELNQDSSVSGVLLYQPLPGGLDAAALQESIDPRKDVEGVHPANLGRLALGRDALVPCTAAAAIACLESTGVAIAGSEAVVVGRSAIVGKPAAMLLLARHATVTQCHTRTRDLAEVCRRADILIVAAGRPRLIGGEHMRDGAVVIDVGTHRVRLPDGTGGQVAATVGDVRTEELTERAAFVTPVPGGVGPVTVAMLWANVVTAAERFGL